MIDCLEECLWRSAHYNDQPRVPWRFAKSLRAEHHEPAASLEIGKLVCVGPVENDAELLSGAKLAALPSESTNFAGTQPDPNFIALIALACPCSVTR